MKTIKNIGIRGFLVMVLTLMAITAVDMMGIGTASCKTAQAIAIKVPGNANPQDAAAARKLSKSNINAANSYKWKNGRLVQLRVSKVKPDQLKAFTGLTDLYIENMSDSAWKTADFSRYKNLKKLHFSKADHLKKLDISKNKKLIELGIGDILKKGKLKKLDLSKNKNLKNLSLTGLSIKKLDVSKNTKLQNLFLSMMDTDVDLSKLKKLREVNIISNNKISTLSMGNASSLKWVYLFSCNNLKQFTVSNCKKLSHLDISGNKLAQVNINHCPKLLLYSPYPTKNADGTTTSRRDDSGIRLSKTGSNGLAEHPVVICDGKTYLWVSTTNEVSTDGTDSSGWKLQN